MRSPYKCYAGLPIYDNDMIIHPNGVLGRVTYSRGLGEWIVRYSQKKTRNLRSQIGENKKGMKIDRRVEHATYH